MLAETLQTLVEQTEGARGAILMGFDGIAVVQHLAPASSEFGHQALDLEAIATELSFRLGDLRNAMPSAEFGELVDLTLNTSFGSIVLRPLSPEYFVAIVVSKSGIAGKGRFLLGAQSKALAENL